jgi:tRNA (adenine22-N1)-methyltransferase
MTKGRLKAVLDMTPACKTAADIGCDHGKLAVALIESGKAKHVIATDISAASLHKAQLLACAYPKGRIECRLGDGLMPLQTGEADTVIMAGWGGRNMAKALIAGKDRLTRHTQLILQPMSEVYELRRDLSAHGFRILDESIVREDRRCYEIIRLALGDAGAYTLQQLRFGPVLLQNRSKLLYERLQKETEQKKARRDMLLQKETCNAQSRAKELNDEIEELIQVIYMLKNGRQEDEDGRNM